MRNHFLCSVSAVAISMLACGASSAADMPVRAAPQPASAIVAAPTWAGWYLGGHAGEAWSKNSVTATPAGDAFLSGQSIRNAAVGLHGGYNWQYNQWVFGIEGDWTWSPGQYNTSDTFNSDTSLRHRTDWLGSVRGRLGMAFDRTLIYATGGVAWLRGQSSLASTSNRSDRNFTASGAVVGGGIEWKAAPQISVRLEALHYMFDKDITHTAPGGLVATDHQDKMTVVRAGVSYHFASR